jgi:WD40 repeat protein
MRVWDLTTGECVRSFDTGHEHGLSNIAVSANMRAAISAGVWDGAPRLWDLVERRGLVVVGHSAWVTATDIDADGHLAVSGHNDGTACVWDVATGRLVQQLTGHRGPVRVLQFAG